MTLRTITRTARWLAAAVVLLGGVHAASAHALLRKAVPGVGSTVHSTPPDLDLLFSEAVEPSLCRVTVRDAAGAQWQGGAPRTAPGDARHLLVGLKQLGAGAYTVEWHAVSVDSHATDGKFSFTVAP